MGPESEWIESGKTCLHCGSPHDSASARPCIAYLHSLVPQWIPVSTPPEHQQLVVIKGGLGYFDHVLNQWYTVTGFTWPGRPIEWEVDVWTALPTPPEVSE